MCMRIFLCLCLCSVDSFNSLFTIEVLWGGYTFTVNAAALFQADANSSSYVAMIDAITIPKNVRSLWPTVKIATRWFYKWEDLPKPLLRTPRVR